MADVTMHAEFDSLTVDDEFSSDAQGCIHTATEFLSEVQPEFSLTEDQPLFIELCAGNATLSSVVKARGFDVLPIDHEANRHKTKCKVFQMDLSQQHAIDTLVHITTHYPILAVRRSALWDVFKGKRHTNERWKRRSSTFAFAGIFTGSAGFIRYKSVKSHIGKFIVSTSGVVDRTS